MTILEKRTILISQRAFLYMTTLFERTILIHPHGIWVHFSTSCCRKGEISIIFPSTDEVNWMERGFIPVARDQGKSPYCFPIASTVSVEGMEFASTRQYVPRSEQQVINGMQMANRTSNFENLQAYYRQYPVLARRSNFMPVKNSEGDYIKNQLNIDAIDLTDGVRVGGWVQLSRGEAALEEAVEQQPGVLAVINVDKSFYKFKSKGLVYTQKPLGKLYPHCVNILGFGSTKNSCLPIWYVLSSSAPRWKGDTGVLRMPRGSGFRSIGTRSYIPVPPPNVAPNMAQPADQAGGNKRASSAAATLEAKKAKLVTPLKSDGGKKSFGGHVATPHTYKKDKSPKFGTGPSCVPSKKTFNSQGPLDSEDNDSEDSDKVLAGDDPEDYYSEEEKEEMIFKSAGGIDNASSAAKTAKDKKAKLVASLKSDCKKGVGAHVTTPRPSKDKSPKSGYRRSCASLNALDPEENDSEASYKVMAKADPEDFDYSEEEKEEIQVKSALGTKRNSSAAKTLEAKKSKLVTPLKSDCKKSVGALVATPHLSKKNKSPKSGSGLSAGSSKKTFNSQGPLDSEENDSEASDKVLAGNDPENYHEEEKEETIVKSAGGTKRANSAAKTPEAKLVALPKSDGGKKSVGGHSATPHPSKKYKSPNSGSGLACGTCKKIFNSLGALNSHAKAKHSATK